MYFENKKNIIYIIDNLLYSFIYQISYRIYEISCDVLTDLYLL